MNNLKSTWIVSILLIVILFLFTVYPATNAFVNVPKPFQDVFRVLLFVAILSLMVFLLTEMNNWYKRCQMLSRSNDQHRNEKESSVSAIGLHYKIDTSENYQQLIHYLTDIIHASLMAQSVFIYLFNGAQPLKSFSCEGDLFKNFHLNPKPELYQAGHIGPDYLKYYHNPPKIGTLMLAPISVNGSYVGFIGTDSVDKETWGKEDLDLLITFSNLFSNAVLQIDVVDQQEVYISFFKDLFRLNTEITFGIEPHELYKQAAGILKKFFNFDKLTFAFKNKDHSSVLTIEYVEGSEADYTIGHEISLKNGVWGPIILQNKSTMVKDYDKSKLEFRFQPGDLKIIPFRSALGIPILSAAKEAGGILLESFKIDNYTYTSR